MYNDDLYMTTSLKLLCHVSPRDIKLLEGEQRRIGYNIGDLLGMPHFVEDFNSEYDGRETASVFKGSIVDYYYYQFHPETTPSPAPCIQQICEATQRYLDANYTRLEKILNFVQKETCLCVHLRLGDNKPFVNVIKYLAKQYRYVLILSGIHDDQRFSDSNLVIRDFVRGINNVLSQGNNIYFYNDTPDAHLAIMYTASHLLVHHGGLSALGAIVATGQVFVTPDFKHAIRQKWHDKIDKTLINIVPIIQV